MERGLKLIPCGPILYLALEYDDGLGATYRLLEGDKDNCGYEEIAHSLEDLDRMEKENEASYIYLKSTTEHSAPYKCYQRFEDILNLHERYLRMKYSDIGCTVATQPTSVKKKGKMWYGIKRDASFNKMLGKGRVLEDPNLVQQFEKKVIHDARVRKTKRMEELYKNPRLLKRLAEHADKRLPPQNEHDLGRLFIKNFALWEYVGLLKTCDMRFGRGVKAEHGLDFLLLKQASRQNFSDYIFLRDSYTKGDWTHIIKWIQSFAKEEGISSGISLTGRDKEVAAVLDFSKLRTVMNTTSERVVDRMAREAIAASKRVLTRVNRENDTGVKKHLTVVMLYYLLDSEGLTNLRQKDFQKIYAVSKSTFHRRKELIDKQCKPQPNKSCLETPVKSWLEVFS